MVFPVHVPSEILGWPPQLEQGLLEGAPLGGMHDRRDLVDLLAHQTAHLLGAKHLGEDCLVGAQQHETVGRMFLDAQPAVPAHGVGDVDEQGTCHRVARVAHEDVDDLLGIMAGSHRIPQPQRGEPVGVDVLGGSLQLGERGNGMTALVGQGMIDLQQQGSVGLDDEGTRNVRHPVNYDSVMAWWARGAERRRRFAGELTAQPRGGNGNEDRGWGQRSLAWPGGVSRRLPGSLVPSWSAPSHRRT